MKNHREKPLILIIDDDAPIRQLLIEVLSDRYACCEAESAEQALAALARDNFDLVISDIRMGGMSGLALFERLTERGLTDAMPVLFLTGHGDVPTAVAAVKRGAFDFVEKPFSNNALVDRIEHALAASAAALVARRSRTARMRGLSDLSEREQEVMRLIAQGMPNKLIADALNLSVRTVEVHRARVFDKLKVGSAVELANLLHQTQA